MSSGRQIPFFTNQYQEERYGAEIRKAVDHVISSGQFILGDEVKTFERRLGDYMGCQFALGVANGSDALYLAVRALQLPKGSEVLTTPFTFFASTACIVRNHLKPVFVDVDYETHHVTPEKLSQHITNKTSAILSVDLFSHTADNASIAELARQNQLRFIEDAAEAFGMRFQGQPAGSLSDVAVLSFFPTKTLGGFGDGGAVLTQSEALAATVRRERVHGAAKKYHHTTVGINSRLDTLQAAVLNVKMNYVDAEIAERARLVQWYRAGLDGCSSVRLPVVAKGADPVWYVFSVKADKRDDLEAFLNQAGIGTSVYYPVPMHLQECFRDLGYRVGDFPVAERLSKESLALPLYVGMTESDVHYVCDTVKQFYR